MLRPLVQFVHSGGSGKREVMVKVPMSGCVTSSLEFTKENSFLLQLFLRNGLLLPVGTRYPISALTRRGRQFNSVWVRLFTAPNIMMTIDMIIHIFNISHTDCVGR